MKRAIGLLVVFAALGMGGEKAKPIGHAEKAFERLRSLVGKWEGKHGDTPVSVTYEMVSGGTCLMERLTSPDTADMVTIYHLDGDTIMCTHFCGADNQPRMRFKPASDDPKAFAFRFVDVTNLASPKAGHMQDLTVTLVDDEHFTQDWTWNDGGKDATEKFRYTRKK